MSSRAGLLLLIVVFGLTTVACGGDPPDKEIQQARGAIETARAAGADRYAVAEFNAATEALKNADLAVQQRDYRLALNHALDSLDRAQTAAKQAADGKAAARVNAERAIAAATTAIATAVARVRNAETARAPARLVSTSNTAITDARQRVQEARTAFEAGDYLSALDAANAATASMKATIERIDGATPSAARRRPV